MPPPPLQGLFSLTPSSMHGQESRTGGASLGGWPSHLPGARWGGGWGLVGPRRARAGSGLELSERGSPFFSSSQSGDRFSKGAGPGLGCLFPLSFSLPRARRPRAPRVPTTRARPPQQNIPRTAVMGRDRSVAGIMAGVGWVETSGRTKVVWSRGHFFSSNPTTLFC